MKNLIKIVIVLSVLCGFNCYAGCSSISPGAATITINSDIQVPKNAPVGSVIGTYTVSPTVGSATSCYGMGYSKYMKGSPTGTMFQTYTDIYTTNIPGIGFAICFQGCHNQRDWHFIYSTPASGDVNFVGTQFIFYLVVIGDVSSGKLDSGLYADLGVDGVSLLKISVAGANIISTTCNLDSTAIQVPFGDMPVDGFSSVGYTSQSKDFNIALTCNREANISISLNGNQSSESSNTSVLALTNSGGQGTASGVGVQILYNNNPLVLNQSIALKKTDGNVKETFPFSARYYQTKSTVTAGDANATATLNITYQ